MKVKKNAKFIVYKHTFPNKKVYIGITSQSSNRRWREGEGYKGQLVHNAIIKYGWDNINHEVLLSGISESDAKKAEINFIKAHRSNEREFGYNVKQGGDIHTGFALRKETREKMSVAKQGANNWIYGKHLSEETRKKLSESHKGKKRSPETVRKAAEKITGSKAYNAKSVVCVETGEIYGAISEAARDNGIRSQDIWEVCTGRRGRKTAGGFHWRYERRN